MRAGEALASFTSIWTNGGKKGTLQKISERSGFLRLGVSGMRERLPFAP